MLGVAAILYVRSTSVVTDVGTDVGLCKVDRVREGKVTRVGLQSSWRFSNRSLIVEGGGRVNEEGGNEEGGNEERGNEEMVCEVDVDGVDTEVCSDTAVCAAWAMPMVDVFDHMVNYTIGDKWVSDLGSARGRGLVDVRAYTGATQATRAGIELGGESLVVVHGGEWVVEGCLLAEGDVYYYPRGRGGEMIEMIEMIERGEKEVRVVVVAVLEKNVSEEEDVAGPNVQWPKRKVGGGGKRVRAKKEGKG